jgi:single-stranded-DNA-specific exonuclease
MPSPQSSRHDPHHPREAPPRAVWSLEQGGVHPLLARLLCRTRRAQAREETRHPCQRPAAARPAEGHRRGRRLLADAIAAGAAPADRRRLRLRRRHRLRRRPARAGACWAPDRLDYLVPDRFDARLRPVAGHVARSPRRASPDLLVTVDNGIASVEGVAALNRLGIATLVTDHHLPALPLARRGAARCRRHRQPQPAGLPASRARRWPASA